MINKMIILSIIFLPLQNYGFRLFGGSRYDISAFIILFIAYYVSIKNQIFNKKTVLIMFLFLFSQFFIFSIMGTTPFYRLLSGMIWLGGLLLIILSRDRIIYNPIIVYKTILFVLILTSCVMFYELLFLGANRGRPEATFEEPSKAALAVFSAAAGVVGIIYNFKLTKRLAFTLYFSLLILFTAGLSTLSMHIVTFMLTVILIGILNFPINFSKIKPRQLGYFSLIIFLIIFGLNQLMATDYFFSRINIFSALLNNNLSLLSWRAGFDQMIASVNLSPILGSGLGATGFIHFESQSMERLLSIQKWALNITDAYSLTFRLIIEIGLPLFLVMIFFFIKKIWSFKNYLLLKELPLSYKIPVVFNFLFSVALIIGSFIKEPLYPSSLLYVGILLFATSKIKY